MILLFEPGPTALRWRQVENGNFTESYSKIETGYLGRMKQSIGDLKQVEAVGYILPHGGAEVKLPVSLITPKSLASLKQSIEFLPDLNESTFQAVTDWTKELPNIPHFLFCETAFFADLPVEASTYAIPYKLAQKKVRRYGGYGLFHQFAWEQVQPIKNHPSTRVISICLSNYLSVTAIRNGRPLETSIGFTPIEGIPSSYTCGDLDATVIFQLNSQGMSFREINDLLTTKSGLTGVNDEKLTIPDLLQNWENPKLLAVKELFVYSVLKYIGAFMAVLGGVDTLVFTGEYLKNSANLITEICNQLSFLGLKQQRPFEKQPKIWRISTQDSEVDAYGLDYNRWEIMTMKMDTLKNARACAPNLEG